jgi:ATP phosphoribosyltransferase regulatory subunit
MRDFGPAEARILSGLGRSLLGSFELYGYERVTVPAFEYALTLERGLGALDPREVLRFVEPETGEVVALRPDMTPQIARLVATRLRSAPDPIRLCYEGSIVRLRRERARRHRQIPQAGIELIGAKAPAGDLEVLEVAGVALRATGLTTFLLDLGHARIAGSLIEAAPEHGRAGLSEALGLKDAFELERRAAALGMSRAEILPLVALTELHGESEIWPAAKRALQGTAAEPALTELERVFERAVDLAPRVSVDLGEVRDLGYYTGVTFQLLSEGPGEPVAAGGRYDGLLARFGTARPAAGFAIALDNLSWALGRPESPVVRVLVVGKSELVRALRDAGVAAAPAPEEDPLAYARAFRYSHVLDASGLVQLATGARIAIAESDPFALAQAVRKETEETCRRS